MACFLAPVTEAVIVTAVEKKMEAGTKDTAPAENSEGIVKIPLSRKLKWLTRMLWGGAFLLAFEHVWHGEVIPTFPFLTAVKEGEVGGMLAEMGTAGVTMAVLVTAAWVGMVIVSNVIEKRQAENTDSKEVKV